MRDRSWLLETALANGEETEIRRLCCELEAALEAGVPPLGRRFLLQVPENAAIVETAATRHLVSQP